MYDACREARRGIRNAIRVNKVLDAARQILHKLHSADLSKVTAIHKGEGVAVISGMAWCDLRDALSELDRPIDPAQELISAAAAATEMFSDDELEEFANEMSKVRK